MEILILLVGGYLIYFVVSFFLSLRQIKKSPEYLSHKKVLEDARKVIEESRALSEEEALNREERRRGFENLSADSESENVVSVWTERRLASEALERNASGEAAADLYCSNCGVPTQIGSNFCSKCGCALAR